MGGLVYGLPVDARRGRGVELDGFRLSSKLQGRRILTVLVERVHEQRRRTLADGRQDAKNAPDGRAFTQTR